MHRIHGFALILLIMFIYSCDETASDDIDSNGENSKFDCYFESPVEGEKLLLGGNIVISIIAFDKENSIEKVVFYIDDYEVENLHEYPYVYVWDTEIEYEGDFELKAVAYNNNGESKEGKINISLLTTIDEGGGGGNSGDYAEFTVSNTEPLVNEEVQFTDQSTGDVMKYEWDFGDGNTSESYNPRHTYTQTGLFTVSLIVGGESYVDTIVKVNYINVQDDGGSGGGNGVGGGLASGQFGTVRDIKNNTYRTVLIGNQWWMVDDLRIDKYPDGTRITDWNPTEVGSGVEMNTDKFYTYQAALKACPDGWHLPSDEEWIELELYVGVDPRRIEEFTNRGTTEHANSLKSTYGWKVLADPPFQEVPFPNGNNYYGFNVSPTGYINHDGVVSNEGYSVFYWTSSTYYDMPILRGIGRQSGISRSYDEFQLNGHPVRCVKD